MGKYIKIFQELHGLAADGVIGKKTLSKIKEVFHIPTNEALAHFMGNTHHESDGFEVVVENLNYSAQGLLMVFPRYFKTLAIAKEYARRPEAIANVVYANRMGNGSQQTGDGYRYRGRGVLQTTGRDNYKQLGQFLGVNLLTIPDLVAEKYFFEAAIFYFNVNNLWPAAATVTDASIRKVRIQVNGGINGLEEVNALVKKYYLLVNS